MKIDIPLETYDNHKPPLVSDNGLITAMWICAVLVILIGTWQTALTAGAQSKADELAPIISGQVARADTAEKAVDVCIAAANRYAAVSVAQEATIETLNEDNAALTKSLRARWIAQQPKRTYAAHKSAHITTSMRNAGSGTARWRPIVARYFHGNTDAALRVMAGESGGNPNNSNGPCLGLFQIDKDMHAKKIAEKARQWGMKPNLYDPVFNIRFAAYMTAGGRNWSNWTVKP